MKSYSLKWFDGHRVFSETFWNAMEYIDFLKFLRTNEILILGDD